MSVQIKNITIEKLGPLDSISLELGNLNLIYGRNETGKTYLVEFVLQSLFRHASNWSLRDVRAEGSITLTGISQKPIFFSPSSPKKIEDYWDENELGFPLNMSRLLVVKGGDLNLDENVPRGVGREFLKTALTNQVVLDDIWKKIPATVQKATLINQQITGHNQGKIKEYNNAKQDLANLANLLDLIDKNYSRGPVSLLELESVNINSQLQNQNQAKRHQAYLISNERKALLVEKELLSDTVLSNLRDHIRDLRSNQLDFDNLKEKAQSSKNKSEDYLWLEATLLAYIGSVFLGSGLITLILEQLILTISLYWAGLVAAILGAGFLVYYLIGILRWSSSIDESSERLLLQKSFQEKFGHLPRGLVDIRDQKNKLQETYLLHKNNQTLCDKKSLEIENNKLQTEALFQNIIGDQIDESDWDRNYNILKSQSTDLTGKIHALDLDLSKLNIPEEDYLIKPGSQSYDLLLIESLEEILKKLDADLSSYYQELDSLKIRACDQTGDDLTTPWPDVLHNLRNKHIDLIERNKIQTAELVAQIGMTEILTKIQGEEDQKIKNNINTSEVSDMLTILTGKYHQLDLIDSQILAGYQNSMYPLEDLSTGAREQIQLALRLGIASRITGGDPLFIILDDAFQHSDWQRREYLVKQVILLVKKGWQVTYLTMDDHIRDLFLKYGKAANKKQFTFYEFP